MLHTDVQLGATIILGEHSTECGDRENAVIGLSLIEKFAMGLRPPEMNNILNVQSISPRDLLLYYNRLNLSQ